MHTMMGLHSVQHTSQQVRLRWADGAESTFAAIWLRDNIPAARHRADGQKLFDITELPAQVHIRDAALSAQGGLRVSFEPEHLDAEFDAHWLARYARPEAGGDEPRVAWNASLATLPRADFHDISGDPRPLAAWLRAVLSHGFALHGRGAFSAERRHLQGCYADIDSLRSTLRRLERSLGEAPGA
jgi:DUF971 family protein